MLKFNIFIFFTFLTLFFATSSALQCYTGFKLLSGNGDEKKECEDNSDYCYNMTASAGVLLSAWKAGCSTYRCFLSQDTCRTMDLQGIPVSFCCCSTDLCNGRDTF